MHLSSSSQLVSLPSSRGLVPTQSLLGVRTRPHNHLCIATLIFSNLIISTLAPIVFSLLTQPLCKNTKVAVDSHIALWESIGTKYECHNLLLCRCMLLRTSSDAKGAIGCYLGTDYESHPLHPCHWPLRVHSWLVTCVSYGKDAKGGLAWAWDVDETCPLLLPIVDLCCAGNILTPTICNSAACCLGQIVRLKQNIWPDLGGHWWWQWHTCKTKRVTYCSNSRKGKRLGVSKVGFFDPRFTSNLKFLFLMQWTVHCALAKVRLPLVRFPRLTWNWVEEPDSVASLSHAQNQRLRLGSWKQSTAQTCCFKTQNQIVCGLNRFCSKV